ncbi:hypothetical protein Rsub_08527 [Raphidocelis subcapitata]|uniref:Uncharacterized protein n=1 Tax=Raphidocelis subcapitata TaxID=307507 RepID=A0A2V0P6T3_9CHLO|nr:hypothetical protein Rsub_08527 [Raphidocelis subcapitata]|eukprot:GBF95546.1 hypothetical protein Rsub_08527 [Raphidocelis subcapitata]
MLLLTASQILRGLSCEVAVRTQAGSWSLQRGAGSASRPLGGAARRLLASDAKPAGGAAAGASSSASSSSSPPPPGSGGGAGGGKTAGGGGFAGAGDKAREAASAARAAGPAAIALAAAWGARLRKEAKRVADHAHRTSAGQAAALQGAALWQAHSGKITAAAALGAAYLLYCLALPAAGLLTDAPERHPLAARAAAAAACAAVVAGGAAWARARGAVRADRVYRLAMLKLNADPGVLEVMGAPLAGSPVRAEITSGGGVYLRDALWPRRRPRRLQMAFRVAGPARDGTAFVTVRRVKGKYDFKLLAVELDGVGGAVGAGAAVGAHAAKAAAAFRAAAAGARGGAGPAAGAAAKEPEAAGAAAGGAAAAEAGAEAPARIYLAGDAAALLEGSALRELAAPLARAAALEARHEIEDDLDAALGEWRPGAAAAAAAAADPDQFTAWQRLRRAWAGARTYAQKHWGVGYPREAAGKVPEEGSAPGGGGGGGGKAGEGKPAADAAAAAAAATGTGGPASAGGGGGSGQAQKKA